MPILKNAEKALRKSHKLAAYNKSIKDNINFLEKQILKLAKIKDSKVEAKVKEMIKAIDKAVQKSVLKKNTAARKKSRIIQAVKKITAAIK